MGKTSEIPPLSIFSVVTIRFTRVLAFSCSMWLDVAAASQWEEHYHFGVLTPDSDLAFHGYAAESNPDKHASLQRSHQLPGMKRRLCGRQSLAVAG